MITHALLLKILALGGDVGFPILIIIVAIMWAKTNKNAEMLHKIDENLITLNTNYKWIKESLTRLIEKTFKK